MIKLEGKLINVFTQEGGTNKKGESFDERDKIQVMGAVELPNGDVRHELFTLGVDNGRDYEPFVNKTISLACGYFANGKTVVFYPAKGALSDSYPSNGIR